MASSSEVNSMFSTTTKSCQSIWAKATVRRDVRRKKELVSGGERRKKRKQVWRTRTRLTSLSFLQILPLPLPLTSPLLPLGPLPRLHQRNHPSGLGLTLEIELLERFLGRDEDEGVHLDHSVEERVERVGRSKEVELVISTFSLREGSEEGSSSSSGEESGELEDVAAKEGRGRRGKGQLDAEGRRRARRMNDRLTHRSTAGKLGLSTTNSNSLGSLGFPLSWISAPSSPLEINPALVPSVLPPFPVSPSTKGALPSSVFPSRSRACMKR